MPRLKRFEVELALTDPDGSPSRLAVDLCMKRAKRLRNLDKLSDDFLDDAEPLAWPKGNEGAWIKVPLDDDVAICQWDPGDKTLWDLFQVAGRLKVVRIVERSAITALMRQFAVPDED